VTLAQCPDFTEATFCGGARPCDDTKPICCGGCSGDTGAAAVCTYGKWKCPTGYVSINDCPGYSESTFCHGDIPDAGVDGGPASSLRVCADVDAGQCISSCDPFEVCFTHVTCGPLPDGGSVCSVEPAGSDAGADNRCHRVCNDGACAVGEDCMRRVFFGCTDWNASPTGHPICCADGGY
jgi:hypothetical protein